MEQHRLPALPWPGFAPGRALILRLPARWLEPAFGPTLEIHGTTLARKREFHITVLNRAMSRTAAGAIGEAGLRGLYASLVWTPARTGRYALLRTVKTTDAGALDCWSLIEHLDLPAMHAFRNELARALGPGFADPVPHVTHYVRGDPSGIAVPDTRALARLQVGGSPA